MELPEEEERRSWRRDVSGEEKKHKKGSCPVSLIPVVFWRINRVYFQLYNISTCNEYTSQYTLHTIHLKIHFTIYLIPHTSFCVGSVFNVKKWLAKCGLVAQRSWTIMDALAPTVITQHPKYVGVLKKKVHAKVTWAVVMVTVVTCYCNGCHDNSCYGVFDLIES